MNQTISKAFSQLVESLTPAYDAGEAESIANILFEDLLKISRTDRLVNSEKSLSELELEQLESATKRLLSYEPVQHIVGFAYFCEHLFKVTPDTLIPRPETEELVYLIANENKGAIKILDIGTGTGCIPISLKLKIQEAQISAWDISPEALSVAKSNAESLSANVQFELMDALNITSEEKFDIIVSNPPYIPYSDKASMHQNVLDFEPGLALFVEDKDPLLFYQKIAEFGTTNLNENGKLYFEIHERLGQSTKEMLLQLGYENVEILQDLNGKDRMVKAQR
ncbi:peptide chain release factor N(5)-glutamine methyltransferase [Marinoscillum pacificum]|uniref:peptide chain release factor N(5)-glutamine methyltransferase n=1 Tax=Marinoscillum pacificum TaxID=392723 RepID=UPI00215740CF|nr:peptide chain release factor N(5)-glutamine methyltransferase [Marinoscillum pacificum]